MTLNDDRRNELINIAQQVRRWAYVPYSKFRVGAALLTESGKIYDGCNIENAAYTPTICAERVAVFKAVSDGERSFTAIAVVTDKGVAPCGVCRQVLAEFGMDTIVLIAEGDGKLVQETTVRGLLPGAFTPGDLNHQY